MARDWLRLTCWQASGCDARANEILKAASAYFARELDPRLPR